MQLKILSLNIWDGGKLLDGAIDFILESNADIVFLQEVYDGKDIDLEPRFRSLEVLKSQLGYTNYDYAAEFIDNRSEGAIPQGNAIFSKFPISYREVTFFDRPFDKHYVEKPENFPTISRNVEHVIIESPVGAINCFNFHGVWDLDGDNDSPARQNMSDMLIKLVSDKGRVILCGDTNAKPTNKSMIRLEDKLLSVFGNSLDTTFNMKQKTNPGYATAAVDMLFISHDVKVVSSECPQVDISDHLPLIATLEI
jgi:endonuclease/exonuclease/phosphatase family metal-dependent hydrolase